MHVFVIDLETTGLDPQKHGIIEFAAIRINLYDPTESVKSFVRWLNPEGYVWSNYCLRMHIAWILRITDVLLKGNKPMDDWPPIVNNIGELQIQFKQWLVEDCALQLNSKPQFINFDKLVPAGKNFDSFDRQFLKHAGFMDCFAHRSLDPASHFVRLGDKKPPDLKTCKARAMEENCIFPTSDVAHEALADAMDVAKLLWHIYGK